MLGGIREADRLLALSKKMKLIIPDIPPSLNQLLKLHWAARKRVKERFGWSVMIGVANSDIDPSTFQVPPKKVRLNITIYQGAKGRFRDPDNCLKVILDFLKSNGVIHDDSGKWVDVPQPVIKRDGVNPRTEVEIETIITDLEDL